MELNFLYEGLKDDNRIFELKDEKLKQNSFPLSQNEVLNKKSPNQSLNNSSGNIIDKQQSTSSNNTNQYLLKIKLDNNEENFFNYKNFINQMKLSEFYL